MTTVTATSADETFRRYGQIKAVSYFDADPPGLPPIQQVRISDMAYGLIEHCGVPCSRAKVRELAGSHLTSCARSSVG